jgi:hypothetical protein
MATSTRVSGFSPAATQFFEDLEDQNSREFWLAQGFVRRLAGLPSRGGPAIQGLPLVTTVTVGIPRYSIAL